MVNAAEVRTRESIDDLRREMTAGMSDLRAEMTAEMASMREGIMAGLKELLVAHSE